MPLPALGTGGSRHRSAGQLRASPCTSSTKPPQRQGLSSPLWETWDGSKVPRPLLPPPPFPGRSPAPGRPGVPRLCSRALAKERAARKTNTRGSFKAAAIALPASVRPRQGAGRGAQSSAYAAGPSGERVPPQPALIARLVDVGASPGLETQ